MQAERFRAIPQAVLDLQSRDDPGRGRNPAVLNSLRAQQHRIVDVSEEDAKSLEDRGANK